MKTGILWSVIFAGAASLVVAAQTPRLELLSQLGGTADAVDAAGTMIVLGVGPRLVTVDASDASQLIELGRSAPLPNRIADLAVDGEVAYAAADLHGVFVFSLEDPAQPIVMGSWMPRDSAVAVCAVDDLLLVADRDAGLSILDRTDPWALEPIGSFDTPGQAIDVAVAGTIAYVADTNGGLRILSIADPAHPQELAALESLNGAAVLCLQGDVIYVIDQHSKFHTVSIADPEHPVLLASLDIKYPVTGTVVGDYAYISTNYAGMHIVSIADPAHPVDVGTLPMSGTAYAQLDGLLCVAEASYGLHVYSLDDPKQPEEVGALDSAFYASRLAVSEDLLYVLNSSKGIEVVSVVDPRMPQRMSAFPLPEATNLDLAGDLLVVCEYDSLAILDATDPGHLIEWGRVALPSSPRGVDVEGDMAYVICEYDGLQIVSLADPAHPLVVASLPVDGYGADVVVRGDWVYVAASGLHIISIADLLHPVEISALPSDQSARSLVLVDEVIFFSEGSMLRMISVIDPSHPVEVARKIFGLGAAVAISSDMAIVGLEWVGVRMLDMANLASLIDIGGFDTTDRASDVILVDDIVYVADERGGLMVLRMVEEGNP